jgi:small multidrug resistance family-3 protein
MTVARSILLFILAAIAEIGDAWLIWQGSREHRGWIWVGTGVVALGVYGFVATLQPDSAFGRILAAYGGIFVAGSLLWGMALDGYRPDRWDITGALICLAGVGVIMYPPAAPDSRSARGPLGACGARRALWPSLCDYAVLGLGTSSAMRAWTWSAMSSRMCRQRPAPKWGSSPHLVGLLRHSEEVPGGGVDAFHGRLLAAAADGTRMRCLGGIQHRAAIPDRAWTVAHDGRLAPDEKEGAGGVRLVLRGRLRGHPAVVSDVALHEVLSERVLVAGRVVNQVAGDVSRRRLKLHGEGAGVRTSCEADRCRGDCRAHPRDDPDFAV